MAHTAANLESDPSALRPAILDAVRRTWGFDALRPMQQQAIEASLANRDSLVVMPTGGGKSLCYQVPPLITGKLSLVVSPLIALMKDQVDGLKLAGYPAAALNSSLSASDGAAIRSDARAGKLKLLLVAPERLLMPEFISWLRTLGNQIGSIAIDEAHCISQWGHDFRPEYRRLSELRQHFPKLALHAYTATATPRVREDIVVQLGLRDPAVLVGCFDRPNLTYRVLPRTKLVEQCLSVLRRHKDRAAIIYCISRKDTESIAGSLAAHGVDAKAYHAGLSPEVRRRVQDDFRNERLNVVVATVAFGMGIDRGDVRCVIHAAMPKTVEHYQQETGRAGRDGLPAECVLLHGAGDAARWKRAIESSAAEAGVGPEVIEPALELLGHMESLAGSARCRHRALSEYFGQRYEPVAMVEEDSGVDEQTRLPIKAREAVAGEDGETSLPRCVACDFCLGEMDEVTDSTEVAKKVLSCVFRVGQNSGAAHVADVLRGVATARVLERRHNELTTFGLLRGVSKPTVRSCILQLVDLKALVQVNEPYTVLQLGPQARAILKDGVEVKLFEARHAGDDAADLAPPPPGRRRQRGVDAADTTLSPDELALFEHLRVLRRKIADELGVPPFVVFADTTLEGLARRRPGSLERMIEVKGIGRTKLERFGERFLDSIAGYCRENALKLDVA